MRCLTFGLWPSASLTCCRAMDCGRQILLPASSPPVHIGSMAARPHAPPPPLVPQQQRPSPPPHLPPPTHPPCRPPPHLPPLQVWQTSKGGAVPPGAAVRVQVSQYPPACLPTGLPAYPPTRLPACLLTHLTIRMLSIRHTPHLSTTFMSPSPHTLCMLVRVRPPTCSHVCVRPRVRMCAPAHVFSCVRACARPWSGALPCARRATMCLNAILNACMLSQARTFAEGVCHMPACDSVDAVPCHVLCPVHRGLSCA